MLTAFQHKMTLNTQDLSVLLRLSLQEIRADVHHWYSGRLGLYGAGGIDLPQTAARIRADRQEFYSHAVGCGLRYPGYLRCTLH